MNNVIDLVDEIHFLGEQATGTSNLLQCVWVYDRGIDIDGLRRFNNHLQRGRLARRIERSPLPFGRHRWVSPDRSPDIEIAEFACPRVEFDTWLDEQAGTPLDAEHGPEWRLAVLPFTDGGAGISFVISHCLTDGVGLCEALADAALGHDDAITWPAAASRSRFRALREDAHQITRDVPAIGRAVVAVARAVRSNRGRGASVSTPRVPIAGSDETVSLTTTTVFVDAEDWDTRAQALGGTSNALLAGVAARLALRLGRVAGDGQAVMAIPVNNRARGDARANAITGIEITADPVLATTNLREIRNATKRALIHRQEVPDERFALLPIVPLLPQWVLKRMVSLVVGEAITGASNVGTLSRAVNRPDGHDADRFAITLRYPHMTAATMHRTGGLLNAISGRTRGQVFISVTAYQPSASNYALQQLLSDILEDFSLHCTTNWHRREPAIASR
ncbi:hypothetical protein A5647_12095 [Mycobacterium sp. 1100029.7]|nr:hypothetical protein A5647_12095 [Mycobacterium sp. 1100029.7]